MKKDTGGQAFPRPGYTDGSGEHAFVWSAEEGMTLRDFFAGQALIGFCVMNGSKTQSDISKCAYEIADKMIKVRG